jgi:hypothetical protein
MVCEKRPTNSNAKSQERKVAPRRICAGEVTTSCKSMVAVRGGIGLPTFRFSEGLSFPTPPGEY